MVSLDLGATPNSAKALLSLLLILPFWYISLDLFHPTFFAKSDLILILAYCICLTLASSLLSSIVSHLVLRGLPDLLKKEDDPSIFNPKVTFIGVLLQIMWFSILLFISYLVAAIFSSIFLFVSFVALFFIPLIIVAILFDKIINRLEEEMIKEAKQKSLNKQSNSSEAIQSTE